MKKSFMFIAILLVFAMVFMVSCQPDPDDTNAVVGTWAGNADLGAITGKPGLVGTIWHFSMTAKTDGTVSVTTTTSPSNASWTGTGSGNYGLYINSNTKGAATITMDFNDSSTKTWTLGFTITDYEMSLRVLEGSIVLEKQND